MQVLVSLGLPRWCSGKDSACQFRKCKRLGLICGSKRFLGVENGNPLQYSCLENSMGRRAWRATVHGVSKSWTRLSRATLGQDSTFPEHILSLSGNDGTVHLQRVLWELV